MLRALCTKIRVGEVASLGSTFTAFVVGRRASTSNTGINIESFLETILFFSLRVKRNRIPLCLMIVFLLFTFYLETWKKYSFSIIQLIRFYFILFYRKESSSSIKITEIANNCYISPSPRE